MSIKLLPLKVQLGPYDPTTVTSIKVSLKDRLLHPFKPFRDYPLSPSYLKRGEFMLELKRGGHARVQTEMVEFIALPFPSSKNLKFCHFTSWSCREGQEMYKKACTCKVVVWLIKPITF